MARVVLTAMLALLCGWGTSSSAARPAAPTPVLNRLAAVIATLESEYVVPVDWRSVTARGVEAIREASNGESDAFARCMAPDPRIDPGPLLAADRLVEALKCGGSRAGRDEAADRLVDAAIRAMVTGLDPHTRYLDPQELARLMAFSPERTHAGFNLVKRGQGLEIGMVQPSTPAAAAGLRPGDAVTAIDGVQVEPGGLDAAFSKLEGPLRSILLLTVRDPERGTRDLRLERCCVFDGAFTLDSSIHDGILAVRIFVLDRSVSDKLAETIERDKDKVRAIVLDLRGNQGGLLDQALAVADLFLDGGEIVTSRGRDGKPERFVARKGQAAANRPLVVLVDGDTAAGAEIIASALQDNRRALVAGRTSFGAGTVQTLRMLPGGRALSLTTSHEYRPDGRRLLDAPVEPDCRLEDLDWAALPAAVSALISGDRSACAAPQPDASAASPSR